MPREYRAVWFPFGLAGRCFFKPSILLSPKCSLNRSSRYNLYNHIVWCFFGQTHAQGAVWREISACTGEFISALSPGSGCVLSLFTTQTSAAESQMPLWTHVSSVFCRSGRLCFSLLIFRKTSLMFSPFFPPIGIFFPSNARKQTYFLEFLEKHIMPLCLPIGFPCMHRPNRANATWTSFMPGDLFLSAKPPIIYVLSGSPDATKESMSKSHA